MGRSEQHDCFTSLRDGFEGWREDTKLPAALMRPQKLGQRRLRPPATRQLGIEHLITAGNDCRATSPQGITTPYRMAQSVCQRKESVSPETGTGVAV